MGLLLISLFLTEGTALWLEAKILDVNGDFLLSARRFWPSLIYAIGMASVYMVIAYIVILRREYRIDRSIARSSQPPQEFVSWWVPPWMWRASAGSDDLLGPTASVPATRVQYPLLDFWVILEGIGFLQFLPGISFLFFAIEAARSLVGVPPGSVRDFGYGILLARCGIAIAALGIGILALRLLSARSRQNSKLLRRYAKVASAAAGLGLALVAVGVWCQIANPVPMAVHQRMRYLERPLPAVGVPSMRDHYSGGTRKGDIHHYQDKMNKTETIKR
ncbi:MAG: hypothetical protein HKL95_00820 [Phycisphaerae bacterium]|nr:hypothetical protein [Phycisphaerae bacterium]